MTKIRVFFIGIKYLLLTLRLKAALFALTVGESLFLRAAGWTKIPVEKDGVVRWKRPNKSNGFTTSTTHMAAASTYVEVPAMFAALNRDCLANQAALIAKSYKNSDL